MAIIFRFLTILIVLTILNYIGIKIHRIIRLKSIKKLSACYCDFIDRIKYFVINVLGAWVIVSLFAKLFGEVNIHLRLIIVIVAIFYTMAIILDICLLRSYHPSSLIVQFFDEERRRVAKRINLSLDNDEDRKRVDRKIGYQRLKEFLALILAGAICLLFF